MHHNNYYAHLRSLCHYMLPHSASYYHTCLYGLSLVHLILLSYNYRISQVVGSIHSSLTAICRIVYVTMCHPEPICLCHAREAFYQIPLQSQIDSIYSHVRWYLSPWCKFLFRKMWRCNCTIGKECSPHSAVSLVASVHACCRTHLETSILYMCISFTGIIDLELLVKSKLTPKKPYYLLVLYNSDSYRL